MSSTSNAIEKLLSIARAEIGYLEKETNSNLDNKTANAGDENYNKYARDLDKTILYNGRKNGYSWCDIWCDWCFITAFGFEKALELTCQPVKGAGAGCTYSAQYYKNKGQFHKSNPKAGDQIFFTNDGGKTFYHTGLVEKVTNDRVYTIEGNTSSLPGVVENGGAVRDKSYSLSYKYIGGYGRPDYSLVDKSISPITVIVTPTSVFNPNKSANVANASVVNVRTGPGTNYTKLGTISKDIGITIIGTDPTRKWYNFKNNEYKNAWISASYVTFTTLIADAAIKYTPSKLGTINVLIGVNIRTGPGTNYAKLGTLPNGTKVTIVGTDSTKKWYKVKNSKYEFVWVSAAYVKITTPVKVTKTTTANLHLRAGRGTNYKSLAIIPKGMLVEVAELSNGWYKVKYNNLNGYSNSNYLK